MRRFWTDEYIAARKEVLAVARKGSYYELGTEERKYWDEKLKEAKEKVKRLEEEGRKDRK